MHIFKGSRISMDFDLVRSVLIFLICFGHTYSMLIGYRHDAKQETQVIACIGFIKD